MKFSHEMMPIFHTEFSNISAQEPGSYLQDELQFPPSWLQNFSSTQRSSLLWVHCLSLSWPCWIDRTLVPMPQFHESNHSCPMDGSNESNDSTNINYPTVGLPSGKRTKTYFLQSYHSSPMDRFDESNHSCPMDGSDESNDSTNIYSLPWAYPNSLRLIFTNLIIRLRWIDSPNLTICVRLIDSTNLTIRVRWTDPTIESNHSSPLVYTRPVLISFPHYCRMNFTNSTDGVDSTVLDNPR